MPWGVCGERVFSGVAQHHGAEFLGLRRMGPRERAESRSRGMPVHPLPHQPTQSPVVHTLLIFCSRNQDSFSCFPPNFILERVKSLLTCQPQQTAEYPVACESTPVSPSLVRAYL